MWILRCPPQLLGLTHTQTVSVCLFAWGDFGFTNRMNAFSWLVRETGTGVRQTKTKIQTESKGTHPSIQLQLTQTSRATSRAEVLTSGAVVCILVLMVSNCTCRFKNSAWLTSCRIKIDAVLLLSAVDLCQKLSRAHCSYSGLNFGETQHLLVPICTQVLTVLDKMLLALL